MIEVRINAAALARAAIAAGEAIERHYSFRPRGYFAAGARAWRSERRRLAREERTARDALLAELGAHFGRGQVALRLADGTIAAVADQLDGLILVPPERIRRIPLAAEAVGHD